MYGESRSHRQLIDRIHSEYSCCGVKSIDDFVDLSEIDKRLPTQTKLWPCNEWEYCGVPLSCCKSILCSQKTQLLHDGWDTMNITEKWFNKDGCVKKLDIAYLFLNYPNQYITEFIMILVLGCHVCAMLLTQILITASVTLHGAILDNSNSSYAWLLDVGKPDRASLIKKLNPNLVDHELEKLSSSQKNDNMEQEDPVGEDKADLFTSTKAITTETDGTHLATETADSSAITNSSTIKNVSLISEGAAEKQVASVADVVPSEDNELEKSPAVSDDEVLVYDSDTGAVKKICEKPGGVPKPKKSKAKPKAPKKKTAKNRKPAKKSKGTSKTKNTKGKKPATNAKNQKQRKLATVGGMDSGKRCQARPQGTLGRFSDAGQGFVDEPGSSAQETFPENESWWQPTDTREDWGPPVKPPSVELRENDRKTPLRTQSESPSCDRNEKVEEKTGPGEHRTLNVNSSFCSEMLEISLITTKKYSSRSTDIKIGSVREEKSIHLPANMSQTYYVNCSPDRFEKLDRYCKDTLLYEPDSEHYNSRDGSLEIIKKVVIRWLHEGHYEIPGSRNRREAKQLAVQKFYLYV
ncbi:Protein CBG25632 [Caenorhabditis briggsae]|uniref:Protein CBG25632 n=1 Tax=Caenorhabditis briggsae TaxID=6238 RepID=B6IFB6_CAEBR|nr:Protein CBG25632 [Caenorhabditis briggsae]CAR98596.1 Protein CBG25632 [Caenorhabditis briggsae]